MDWDQSLLHVVLMLNGQFHRLPIQRLAGRQVIQVARTLLGGQIGYPAPEVTLGYLHTLATWGSEDGLSLNRPVKLGNTRVSWLVACSNWLPHRRRYERRQ